MKKSLSACVSILSLAVISSGRAGAANPVITWDEIAINTAVAASQTLSPGSNTAGGAAIYLSYVHLAVYNAVNSIEKRFQPYGAGFSAPVGASTEVAAIAAAYSTLAYYFPGDSIALASQYAASLATIPDSPAKSDGIVAGQAAANGIIGLRLGDGRGANVPYVYPSSPVAGAWMPTPPAFLAPQTPWVGQMTPFTMATASQFLPDEGPPALTSSEWADDYNQTKTFGSVNSTVRTPEQTETGLFWTEQTARQYARAFRALAIARGLDLNSSARLFAMLWTSYADAFIGCMNAKYHFGFWRPVTAIRNGSIDGNDATVADAGWTPLAATPNHPEYPAAHGCVTGAVANTLKNYFNTPNVSVIVSSTVTNTTHSFSSVRDLENEVEFARIYAGFHYHHSLVQGFDLGRKVSQQAAREFFQPVSQH